MSPSTRKKPLFNNDKDKAEVKESLLKVQHTMMKLEKHAQALHDKYEEKCSHYKLKHT